MTRRTAVVLFQLGGPDALEAVRPFLYNLFRDSDIIDFPGAFLAREWLARMISRRRSIAVAENYRQIGGRSPILELTERQAHGLEQALRSRGMDAGVFVAMRYWHPFTEAAVQKIREGRFEQIVLLPLYPQMSRATTLSSLNEWKRQAARSGLDVTPTELICCYPAHPQYVESIVGRITAALERFRDVPAADIDLVFSAHGVPLSYLRKGDPYKLHVEETVRRVLDRGGWAHAHTLCFQSKVGPQRWLKPSLVHTVHRLAASGRKNLLIVPIAFVTDHIETLHEIGIEVRREAAALGVERFEVMPALNDHPAFIACLADLVATALERPGRQISRCRLLHRQSPSEPEPQLCPRYNEADNAQRLESARPSAPSSARQGHGT